MIFINTNRVCTKKEFILILKYHPPFIVISCVTIWFVSDTMKKFSAPVLMHVLRLSRHSPGAGGVSVCMRETRGFSSEFINKGIGFKKSLGRHLKVGVFFVIAV